MATNPYEMLFTDQNLTREFVIQPFTMNGPATPTGGVDPSASTANTTLFLYGKGAPNYGERIQENMVFMLEHFFNPNEPSFPIPGQVWCDSSVTPSQLRVFSPNKYTVVSNIGNVVGVQSTNSLDAASVVLARFATLFTQTKTFTIFSSTYTPYSFSQLAAPTLAGSTVSLTVTPTPTLANGAMVGFTTGGWEDLFQGNQVNKLRTSFNANGQFIQNVPTPVNPGDAANKAYVDAAISGGTLTLSSLSDVQFATPGSPQTNSFLFFNGSKWTDLLQTNAPFLLLTGGTLTGALILNADPTVNLGAATKQYVDTQPLSAALVQITSPVNQNLLVYDSTLFKWKNVTAIGAGLLPLSGGVMTGAINMNSNALTGLIAPTNPSDAATKAYVDAATTVGTGEVIGGSFSNALGTLTLLRQATTPVTIAGFLPTPNNQVPAGSVVVAPPDPPSVSTPGLFWQSSLSDVFFGSPNTVQDPTNIGLDAALGQVDIQLGRLSVPRARLVMKGTGTGLVFNLNTGSPNTLVGAAPGLQYIVGSNALCVYANGIKQVANDRGFYKMTNISTTTTVTGVTFTVGANTLTIPGIDLTSVLRAGVVFTISGTSTANDGSYIVVSASLSGTDTVVVTNPNTLATTPGAALFVVSGTGTFTYGPFGIYPAMQTGYVFGGPSHSTNLAVSVNAALGVTLTIDTSTTNCNTFGLMCDAVNSLASAYYINPVVAVTSGALGSFQVSGNRVANFSTGTTFVVRYSSGNSGSYTVGPGAPSYNSGTNRTTIPITGTVPSSTIDGILFQDTWGYTMTIENGTIVFYSNVSGTGSAVQPVSGTLLTGITGVNWPITISGSFTGATNAFAPQPYSYKEVGLNGYPSSVIEFATAPNTVDFIEVVIDNDFSFHSFNATRTAVTA